MKQTADDLRFAGDFAAALAPIVSAENERGRSLRQIAEDLGITEPALKKCLSGRTTPCLRTVVLAFYRYRVAVPYSGIILFDAGSKRPRKSVRRLEQLILPFEIQAPTPGDRVAVKLLPKGVRRYELQLMVQLTR